MIITQQEKLESLRYVILPGKCPPGFAYVELHNQAYAYWKQFWGAVYRDAGSPASFVCEDFFRQDYIPILLSENRVIGMHLYTLFHLEQDSARDHRYFHFYPPEFFTYMRERSARYVMSVEFLTIDPHWRKRDVGLSLGEVMIGACTQMVPRLNVDALIAPARADETKVNEMAYRHGYSCFQADVSKRNFKVDLIVGFHQDLHWSSDPVVADWSRRLWNRREDLTGCFSDSKLISQVA